MTTEAVPNPALQGTEALGRLLSSLGDAVTAADELCFAVSTMYDQISSAQRGCRSVDLTEITDQYVDAHRRACQAFAAMRLAIAARNMVVADIYPGREA